METQELKGQILGTDANGKPIRIKVDANGYLILSPLPTGTNNIGDVDVLTLPSLPTGTNDIGKVLNGYKEEVVLASATRTVSGNSAEFVVENYKEAIVFLDVTLASGTSPTLDVKFQTQDPVSLKWFDVTDLTFTQAVAITAEMKTKANLIGKKLRCTYTIAGTTPSFDFSVGLVLKS